MRPMQLRRTSPTATSRLHCGRDSKFSSAAWLGGKGILFIDHHVPSSRPYAFVAMTRTGEVSLAAASNIATEKLVASSAVVISSSAGKR